MDWKIATTIIIAIFGLAYQLYMYFKTEKIGFSVDTAFSNKNGQAKCFLTIINTQHRTVTIKNILFESGFKSPFFIVGSEILQEINHPLPYPLEDGKTPLTAYFDPSELVETMFKCNESFAHWLIFWWFCYNLRVEVVPHVGKVNSVKIDKYARNMVWNKYKNVNRTFEK